MSNDPSNDFDVYRAYPKEMKEIDAANNVYRDVLAALVASSIKNGVFLVQDDIDLIMDAVSEALHNEADHAISTLRDAGIEDILAVPDDWKQLVRKAGDDILDSFRSKPFSSVAVMKSMFAPRNV